MVASSVTLLGAILSLFLAHDGGSRGGSIRLLPDDDKVIQEVDEALSDDDDTPIGTAGGGGGLAPPNVASVVGQLQKKVSKKFSGYFAGRVRDASPAPGVGSGDDLTPGQDAMPLNSTPIPKPKARTFSRSSVPRTTGSAYGYRSRLGSMAAPGGGPGLAIPPARRGSMASTQYRRRRDTDVSQQQGGAADTAPGDGMNFAQRLLMANELNATSLADLWVQAAINVDNEDPFETDTDDDEEAVEDGDLEHGGRTPRSHRPSVSLPRRASATASHRPSFSVARRLLAGGGGGALGGIGDRRFSSSSHVPAIFAHTGVKTPPAALHPPEFFSSPGVTSPASVGPALPTSDPFSDHLRPIAEDRPISSVITPQISQAILEETEKKPPSAFSELPFPIIIQFGLLALHTTTHDQIFYSYLVSKYKVGGLGLNAGHFSQLIALMCLAQIAYQFYLYPNIGPPRGRFSHLAMFRIGSALFIPSYLSVTLYRAFATEGDDGNFIVMAALALSTAVRYCGSTFAYTSVAILLNYMSPPHVIGLSNGLAQSIVSLARFVGPVLGGWLWSISVQEDPSGFPFGFFVITGVCILAIMSSFLIR